MLLHRFADHPLVQIAQYMTRRPSSPPVPATITPPTSPVGRRPSARALLVRAEIVRAWADSCSDRDLEWHLSANLARALVCRLAASAPAPRPHHPGPLPRLARRPPARRAASSMCWRSSIASTPRRPQPRPRSSTPSAWQSPAAWSPRVANLLLDLCADLIAAWQQHAPLSLQSALPPLDLGPILHPARPRDALERQTLLVQAVTLAQRLLADLTPHLPGLAPARRARIARLLTPSPKCIADELSSMPSGHPSRAHRQGRLPHHQRHRPGGDLPQARRRSDARLQRRARHHCHAHSRGGGREWRHARQRGAVLLAQQQLAAQQPLPPYFIMDRAGGWGKCRARLDVLSDGQTQMVALIPPAGGADPDAL